MAERFKAHAWKVCVLSKVPWVRIPLSPPLIGSWSKIMMLSSNKNNILLVSILFVLIGIFLRIYQLNFENYWLDEMTSFWVADPNLSLEETFTRNNNMYMYINLIFIILMRRGRDLNPRWIFIHTHFPSVHLKPLGHLSNYINFNNEFKIMIIKKAMQEN